MSKRKASRKQKTPAKTSPVRAAAKETAASKPVANKPAKKRAASKPAATKTGMLANLNRRNALKILAGLGVSGIGITSLHAYDKNQRTLHDLTVIGQGQSVVVQIHDPSCPTCRRLKSAVTTAMKATPDIHFRLADITTAEGKALQNKYGVPHVTLLFFDGNGTHRHTTRGLLSAEQVRNNIDRYLS